MKSESYIHRFIQPRLEAALKDTPVVLVHGPRQCGKTTLVRYVGDELGYSYLSFDDEWDIAKDYSMYGNDGTVEGDPQLVAGVFGKALELNGTSDVVRISKSDSLNLGEGSFTVECWVNFSEDKETESGGGRIINDRGTGAGGSFTGYQLKISNFGGNGKWGFKDTGIDDASGNYRVYKPTFNAVDGDYNSSEWYHIAMVH